MKENRILIVIVGWNNTKDTIDATTSVLNQSYQNFDIALVDNGSKNKYRIPLETFSKMDDQILWMRNEKNLGFTKAINQVIKNFILGQDHYQYLALLNNDAIADPKWIKESLETIKKKKSKVVASKIIQAKHPERLESAGLYLTCLGEIIAQGYNTASSAKKWSRSCEVFGASGGAVFYDVQIFDQLGLFDENFPMGYEDAEYAMRCFTHNIKVTYTSDSIVHHQGGVSLKKTPEIPRLIQTQYQIWAVYFQYAPWICVGWIFFLTVFRTIFKTLYWILFFRWRSIKAWYSSIFLFLNRFKILLSERKKKRAKIQISSWQFIKGHRGIISEIHRFVLAIWFR